MCGICCILCRDVVAEHLKNDFQECTRLSNRGPDHSNMRSICLTNNSRLSFHGHVLHLRGSVGVPQPAVDISGNVLLWNGEIFDGFEIGDQESDTQVLLCSLAQGQSDDHVLTVMSQIQGPWSFIYYQAHNEVLWFGRDVFGRRSLLWHLPESDTDPFILSSVRIKPYTFSEVPSIGIFKLCLKQQSNADQIASDYVISVFPWRNAVWPGTLQTVCGSELKENLHKGVQSSTMTFQLHEDKQVPSQMPQLNKEIPPEECQLPPLNDMTSLEYLRMLLDKNEYLKTLSRQLSQVLLDAVKTRVFNQQRKPRQYGGDGNFKIQDMNHTRDEDNKTLNHDTRANHDVISTDTGQTNTSINPNAVEQTSDENNKTPHHHTPTDSEPVADSCKLSANSSVNFAQDEPSDSQACEQSLLDNMATCSISSEPEVSSAHVAILFSGGIDSTVIAALADRCVPKEEPIDLINVAFELKDKNMGKKKRPTDQTPFKRWDVPDRLTGHVALSELNADRVWNFIEVNVTAAELQDARQKHIHDLLYPLETVLDDSIGCAVWFAARGLGVVGNGTRRGQQIHSKAKVILCGMGADEQLAGYSRHRVRHKTEGWSGLVNEIELELTRLSARNLGRDDRIITDHGKESRFPFLDEKVVKFLCSLPIHNKADFALPRGLGEKLLLRLCAVELGLTNTATLPKRAIQFGSRIAKMENSKENAADKCDRLTNLQS